MRMIGWLGGAALALSGAGDAAAAAKAPACLTRGQMDALFTYALPALLEGARKSCSATLAPDAFLRASGAGLINRYRQESAGEWPAARDAFQAMSGNDDTLGLLGDDGTRALLNGVISGLVAKEIKPKDCAQIDEAVLLLAPLPASNVGRMATLLVALSDKGKNGLAGDGSPFRLCPAAL